MKEKIWISIIMSVYDEEQYVQEAIDSILWQTYPFIELIIINDASTDRTDTIVRSYTDERLVYLDSSEHQGTYKCRNRAIQMAKGQYLAMMDADDIAMPERLEKQFRYLEAHPDVCAVGADDGQKNVEWPDIAYPDMGMVVAYYTYGDLYYSQC
ncbi:glycosyltransferase family 2 protein [Parabacteroides massiliensis]|jgi:glycosyltransferase involved in cell wall biosynthesis|uniref:glycosyltransferase family 2 protein n=1 Tax=Parabacteroides massiliensis TaxID=1750560 RepID=UPI0009D6AB32|nr:glycosyltransferase family A protein [Parabacteroides massiliensis]